MDIYDFPSEETADTHGPAPSKRRKISDLGNQNITEQEFEYEYYVPTSRISPKKEEKDHACNEFGETESGEHLRKAHEEILVGEEGDDICVAMQLYSVPERIQEMISKYQTEYNLATSHNNTRHVIAKRATFPGESSGGEREERLIIMWPDCRVSGPSPGSHQRTCPAGETNISCRQEVRPG